MRRPRIIGARLVATGTDLAPGILDVGFGSLAGFVGSLYAARMLDAPTLGVYAVLFAAFTLASIVTQNLLFQPVHVALLRAPAARRVAGLRQALPVGALLAVAVAIPVGGIGLLVPGDVRSSDVAWLAATAFALAVMSPLQDFLRSTVHLARRPETAAKVSAVQLAVTIVVVVALHFSGAPRAAVPFGAVAVANAGSLALGLMLVRVWTLAPVPLPPLSELLRSGTVLLAAGGVEPAAGFVSVSLVAAFASAEALGHAEAARVAAMPILVLGIGLHRSIGPRLLEAAHNRSASEYGRERRFYVRTVFVVGALYLGVAGWQQPLNPMAWLVSSAYILDGLVAFRITALLVHGSISGYQPALLAVRENGALLRVAALRGVAVIAVSLILAASLGAYVLPTAELAGSLLAGCLLRRASVRVLNRP